MSNHLGKNPEHPPSAPTHGATRRTLLTTGTIAAGALAGGALTPDAALAAVSASGADAAGVLPDQWPDGPGRLNRPQNADATLRGILRDIDPDRIRHTIETLGGFGTRHTLSTQTDPARGIGAARDWIFHELQSYAERSNGRMKVEIQSYTQDVATRIDQPTVISNVIATLSGSKEPER